MILQQAVIQAKSSLISPVNPSYNFGFGVKDLNLVNGLTDLDTHIREKGGVHHLNNDVPQEVQHIARAAAFTTSVVSSAYMAGVIKRSIDAFMLDPENEQLINDALKGATPTQKEEFAKELKDTVTEKLSIEAKTNEGKKFVEAVTDYFNQAPSPDDLKALFGSSVVASNRLLNILETSEDKNDAIEKAQNETKEAYTEQGNNTTEYNHAFDDFIIGTLGYNAQILSYENGGYLNQAEKETSISIDTDTDKDMLKKLLDWYDNRQGNVTVAEKEIVLWVEQKWPGLDYEELNNVMIDGVMLDPKEMFTPDNIAAVPANQITGTKNFTGQTKAEILAAALKGKNVNFLYPDSDKEVAFAPKLTGKKIEKTESFLDKIIDFFKKLLGLETNAEKLLEEYAEINRGVQDAKDNLLKKDSEQHIRQKMTFGEMNGLHAVSKLDTKKSENAPIKQENETVAENEAPEKKAPEMGR